MYHNKRITKKLEQYIPATKIFEEFSQEAGIAFLDSSLIRAGAVFYHRQKTLRDIEERTRTIFSEWITAYRYDI